MSLPQSPACADRPYVRVFAEPREVHYSSPDIDEIGHRMDYLVDQLGGRSYVLLGRQELKRSDAASVSTQASAVAGTFRSPRLGVAIARVPARSGGADRLLDIRLLERLPLLSEAQRDPRKTGPPRAAGDWRTFAGVPARTRTGTGRRKCTRVQARTSGDDRQ